MKIPIYENEASVTRQSPEEVLIYFDASTGKIKATNKNIGHLVLNADSVSSSDPIFGEGFDFHKQEIDVPIVTNAFALVYTHTFSALSDGFHKFTTYFEYFTGNTTRNVDFQVVINGTIISSISKEQQDNADRLDFNGFENLYLLQGDYTIEIFAKKDVGSGNASIRNIKNEFHKTKD